MWSLIISHEFWTQRSYKLRSMRISQTSTSWPFSRNPSMRTLLITWPLDNYQLTGQRKTNTASLPKYDTSSGMNRIFLSIIPTKLLDDAYQRRNREVCSTFAMTLHEEDTLVFARLQRRFYKVGFTGPLCSKTHTIFASHAQIVRRMENFQEETWCPWILFLKSKFLTFGVSTSWDHSQIPSATISL